MRETTYRRSVDDEESGRFAEFDGGSVSRSGGRSHRPRLLLAAFAIAVATVLLQASAASAAPTKPPTDTSFYVKYPYNGTSTPDSNSNAYSRGCAQGMFDLNHGSANSEVVLDFGAQNSSNNGTYLPKTNTPATYTNIEHYAETFAYGYWACTGTDSTSVLQLGIGTNNSGSLVTNAGGQGWANVVNTVVNWTSTGTYQYVASQVEIVGGGDLEPAWSSQSAAIAWADGYDSVITAPFYLNFGSCDGCPTSAKGGDGYSFVPCSSGCTTWYQYGVWDIAYGENDALPLPEIYFTNQQGEWAAISDYGYIAHGSAVYFQGPLDEHPLDSSSFTSSEAWTNFWNALQGFGGVTAQTPPYSSEITDANS